jgi:hypothetical protein
MGFATFFDVGIVVQVAFVGHVENVLYVVDFSKKTTKAVTCLMAKVDVGWLWHRRLGHVNMRTLQSLHKGNHILGLTDLTFAKDRVCVGLALQERCMNFLILARPSFHPRVS